MTQLSDMYYWYSIKVFDKEEATLEKVKAATSVHLKRLMLVIIMHFLCHGEDLNQLRRN